MDLLLIRKWLTRESSIGELYVDGKFECFVIEDVTRLHCRWCTEAVWKNTAVCSMNPRGHEWLTEPKVKGQTAIPLGRYQLVIDFSQRFQTLMMHVLNVPMFEGIRIHSGNTAADTEGCLLPGRQRDVNKVLESRVAHAALHAKVDAALKANQKVTLSVELAPGAERASIC